MPGILIADDNAKVRQLLHWFIEGNTGYEICGEAENGAQALERAKKIRSSPLITNIHV
jgi:YesN/AraC family two-component response regulator